MTVRPNTRGVRCRAGWVLALAVALTGLWTRPGVAQVETCTMYQKYVKVDK